MKVEYVYEIRYALEIPDEELPDPDEQPDDFEDKWSKKRFAVTSEVEDVLSKRGELIDVEYVDEHILEEHALRVKRRVDQRAEDRRKVIDKLIKDYKNSQEWYNENQAPNDDATPRG